MRRLIKLLLTFGLLALASPARAAIGASGTAAVCTAFNAASGTVTRTEAAGNTVVVVAAIRTTTSTVSSVTDTGGSSYSFRASINNASSARVEVWSTPAGASKSSTSVTINLSASSKFVGCVFEYTGVAALGVTNTATSAAANPAISLTTQDNNNWCVAGFAGQGTGTFTAGTGTLRSSAVTSGGAAGSNAGGAFADNTVATAGTCTNSVTNADTVWALAALELRSVLAARNRVVVISRRIEIPRPPRVSAQGLRGQAEFSSLKIGGHHGER